MARKPTKALLVHFPIADHDKLRAYAKTHRTNMAETIRTATETYINAIIAAEEKEAEEAGIIGEI